jgi:hypothetical protein
MRTRFYWRRVLGKVVKMADPVIISASLLDAAGGRKSFVWYGASDLTIDDAQTAFTTSAPKLDAVIDAQIIKASVTLPLTLPGGLKGAAVDGNRVREGALLSYTANGTGYRYSAYVPSWKNAGYPADSNEVLNTGVYATMISDMLNYSDKETRALLAFIEGFRTFRK